MKPQEACLLSLRQVSTALQPKLQSWCQGLPTIVVSNLCTESFSPKHDYNYTSALIKSYLEKTIFIVCFSDCPLLSM